SAVAWNGHTSHLRLAREAAAASIVLLKNAGSALPLRRGTGSIAVIGSDATESRLGGYSGPGIRPVSIIDGLRAAATGTSTQVRYAPGPGRFAAAPVLVPAEYFARPGGSEPGLNGEYFDNN